MKSTQDNLPISDIKDDIILLKKGGAAIVLGTTAVNFDLLTEVEQIAIISAFGQTLNSLSFPIQIVIRSQRLDITSYLKLLDMAISRQTNPKLAKLMGQYRLFVQSLIKQNEVLDKEFFIIIPISNLELGLFSSKEDIIKKAKTMLAPRQEQITRQLARVGLKTTKITNKALVTLFHNIYNPPLDSREAATVTQPQIHPLQHLVTPTKPEPIKLPTPTSPLTPPLTTGGLTTRPARSHPFVVEELIDTI